MSYPQRDLDELRRRDAPELHLVWLGRETFTVSCPGSRPTCKLESWLQSTYEKLGGATLFGIFVVREGETVPQFTRYDAWLARSR